MKEIILSQNVIFFIKYYEYNKIFNQRGGEVSRSECIDGQVYLFCDNYRNIRCLGAYSTPEYRDGNLLRIKSPILFSDGYYDSYVIYILMLNRGKKSILV